MCTGLIFNIQRYSIHDGPGIRTTVFLKGCPLMCLWCSNPESQSKKPIDMDGRPDSKEYSISEVIDICIKDIEFYNESGGGVTLSGGEPFAQYDLAINLLKQLKSNGIHTAVETTGYVDSEILLQASNYLDLLLYDIKHYDSERHKMGTGVENELIIRNLGICSKNGINILPRIPVIPDFNSTLDDAEGFSHLLMDLKLYEVQLLPFHQMGDRKYELLGKDYAYRGVRPMYKEDLEDYLAVFRRNSINAYI